MRQLRPHIDVLRLLVCVAVLALPPAHGAGATSQVTVVRAPEHSLVPDVAMDADGVLHMVYGLDHQAYYVRSRDNGATFSEPVRVNSTGTVETEMGERGPKLAVGREGTVHVAWVDDWAPGVQTYVRYARSVDGGRSFLERQTLSSMPGVDGVTLAADATGHVLAFWHTMQPPKPEEPMATWLFQARSSDGGASFAANERVKVEGLAGLACSMCMMRARFAADGQALLAFRSAEKNVRDFWVLKGAPEANAYGAIRVNEDNWVIPTCPMCGPELTLDAGGRVLCAFMSRNRVYWAVADPKVRGFALHVATPENAQDEIYPTAVANRKGEVLFVWQVGPMSVKGTATLKCALYAPDGRLLGPERMLGTSFSGTKATAFAGTDDSFYVVTTAK